MHAPRIPHTTCTDVAAAPALMTGLILSDQIERPTPVGYYSNTTLTMVALPLAVIGPGLFKSYTTATSQ